MAEWLNGHRPRRTRPFLPRGVPSTSGRLRSFRAGIRPSVEGMFSRLRSQLPAWRRALRRRRRTLAALALAVLLVALLPSLLPPSRQGVELVIAREDLAAGTVVAPEHLRTIRVAAELVPPHTPTSPEEVLGRTLSRPLGAGAPFHPGTLDTPGTGPLPAGTVLMAVPVPEALAPHLAPGTRIELLSTDPTVHAAVPAQVVELPTTDTTAASLGAAAPSTVPVLVVVDRTRSREVAHALGAGTIMISVIG